MRIDTFPYVDRGLLAGFDPRVHSVYPNLTTVGEVFTSDPTITSFFAGGVEQRGIDTGLDAPFDFPVYFAIRDVCLLHDKPMTTLTETMRQDRLRIRIPSDWYFFLATTIQKRFLSEDGANPRNKLKLAFGLLATLRGMPEIYSGDELAMLGGKDPDNRRDFPGGFAGDENSGFIASRRSSDQQAMFLWIKRRNSFICGRQISALQSGAQQNIFADDTALAYVLTWILRRDAHRTRRRKGSLCRFEQGKRIANTDSANCRLPLWMAVKNWNPLIPLGHSGPSGATALTCPWNCRQMDC